MVELSPFSTTDAESDFVDFGKQDVPRAQKPAMVRDIFTSVAGNYDLMNDLMSLGVHRLWKQHLIACIAPQARHHLLDVAGGTGDITQLFMRAGGGAATLVDLTPEMLKVAEQRLCDQGIFSVDLVTAQAEALPFAAHQFDVYTISFGLRNVADRMTALSEAFRVLKPGGKYYCLEFSPQVLPALQQAYDRYCDTLLPRLGQWVAGDAESYRYLAESIRRFRHPALLGDDLTSVGFQCVCYQPLSGGIVYIHQGLKA